jgi:hypothetical protein
MIKPTTPPTTRLCLRRLFMAYLSNRSLFSKEFFWFFLKRLDVLHETISAAGVPKSHVLPKGRNLLILCEMSRVVIAPRVSLPVWHCRDCGSVPVLWHQLRQVGHHMERNPDFLRRCTDHEQRFGNPRSYIA